MPVVNPLRCLPRYRALLPILLCLLSAGSAAENRSLLWVSTLFEGHSFWDQHLRFTRAAAEDFGFSVQAAYLDSDPGTYQAVLDQASRDPSITAAVLPNLKTQSRNILRGINSLGVPVVTNVIPMDATMVGTPSPGSNWIAEIQVDERRNGDLLTETLLDALRTDAAAESLGTSIQLIALAGSRTDTVGAARLAGLHDALARHPEVELLQVFHGERWSREEAERIMSTALRRYPDVAVVWAANDDLAIGTLSAVAAGTGDGDIAPVVGGIDGTIEMSRLIGRGEACCTIAGLPLHGAWSVVVLADHLAGLTTSEDSTVLPAEGLMITEENVGRYLDFIRRDPGDIDFRQFSRASAQPGQAYDFNPADLLRADIQQEVVQ